MKKVLLYPVIALFLFCIIFFACSNNGDVESKKGRIEKMTDKAAKEIVDHIRTPIEKARSVKKMEEDRQNAVEENLKDQ
jgi:hypothetical protein